MFASRRTSLGNASIQRPRTKATALLRAARPARVPGLGPSASLAFPPDSLVIAALNTRGKDRRTMASTGKKKTTMAKLARESRLRERRVEKEARKQARKRAAAYPADQPSEPSIGSQQ
ncbi:MAG: hypothetical protein WCD11_19705 [Solirubrobacteraceae bacterium]